MAAHVQWLRKPRRRRYSREGYATTYEKVKSLEQAEQYLKPDLNLAVLEQEMSDTECARKMAATKV